MRVVVMGTGGFAVPTFQKLIDSPHDIVAVVTMPLRNVRDRRKTTAPVRDLAESRMLDLFDPENVNDSFFVTKLLGLNADLLFVCDYGKILSPAVIASAKFGGINLHGSLLPKYRGAAPINHALLNGEPTVGVSVIHITPELDAGPIVAQSSPVEVLPTDTAVEIEEKLAKIGAGLVLNVMDQIEAGTLRPFLQSESQASKAPKLKKTAGEIDWNRSARDIFRQYQALQPWPKIFTTLFRENMEPLLVILGRVEVVQAEVVQNDNLGGGKMEKNEKPGEILLTDNNRLIIATGNGLLQIHEIQPSGKKMMDTGSFLRGYPVHLGDRLGVPES